MTNLAMLVATCDEDFKHFDRVIGEFERMAIPFAVNFDHCCDATKRRFKASPMFLGGRENDEPQESSEKHRINRFDESHRQGGLDVILASKRFTWAGYLDTDESFAPWITRKFLDDTLNRAAADKVDLIDTPLIDLWGDEHHYRKDGPFGSSHRERFYHLPSGRWQYKTAIVHAPKLLDTGREVRKFKPDLYFYHWGMMNQEDVAFHIKRWNRIYKDKVGNVPYEFYDYMGHPNKYPPLVLPVAGLKAHLGVE